LRSVGKVEENQGLAQQSDFDTVGQGKADQQRQDSQCRKDGSAAGGDEQQ
jgi:hypothetical protein